MEFQFLMYVFLLWLLKRNFNFILANIKKRIRNYLWSSLWTTYVSLFLRENDKNEINQASNFSNLKLSILPVVDSLSFENFELSNLGHRTL